MSDPTSDPTVSQSSPPASSRGLLLTAVSLIAIVFGLATIRAGGRVLFGDEAARLAAGDYVGFVVWFNFLAGFLYVVAGAGFWARRRWAVWLAAAIAISTVLVFAAFGVHIASGGAWEPRTVAALSLRSVVWIVFSAIAWQRVPRVR